MKIHTSSIKDRETLQNSPSPHIYQELNNTSSLKYADSFFSKWSSDAQTPRLGVTKPKVIAIKTHPKPWTGAQDVRELEMTIPKEPTTPGPSYYNQQIDSMASKQAKILHMYAS